MDEVVILLVYVIIGCLITWTVVAVYMFIDYNREYKRTRRRLESAEKSFNRFTYDLSKVDVTYRRDDSGALYDDSKRLKSDKVKNIRKDDA